MKPCSYHLKPACPQDALGDRVAVIMVLTTVWRSVALESETVVPSVKMPVGYVWNLFSAPKLPKHS